MINRPTNRVVIPRFLPKYSDPDILRALMNGEFWKQLYLGDKKAWWMIVKAIVLIKIEIIVLPVRMLLRMDFGYRTTGVTIFLITLTMLIAYNAAYLAGYLATFLPFVLPILVFFMPPDLLYEVLFVEIRSEGLLIFWMVYMVVSIIQLIRIYRTKDKQDDATKRGNSLLYMLFFRNTGLSEGQIQLFIEPLLTSGIGYVLIATGVDIPFGIFLLAAGILLFLQELYDAVSRYVINM
jgi:hypothetical protein